MREGVRVFSEEDPCVQFNPKAGREETVLSLYLLVPGTGQGPILSSLQLGPILRVESFLRSHLICPNDSCSVNNLAK